MVTVVTTVVMLVMMTIMMTMIMAVVMIINIILSQREKELSLLVKSWTLIGSQINSSTVCVQPKAYNGNQFHALYRPSQGQSACQLHSRLLLSIYMLFWILFLRLEEL